MLNKKAESLIKPFNFLLAFIIIIIFCIILIVSLNFLANKNAEKSNKLVGDVLAEDRWYDIVSKKIDNEYFPVVLQEIWDDDLNRVWVKADKFSVFKKNEKFPLKEKVFMFVKESIDEILPEDVWITEYSVYLGGGSFGLGDAIICKVYVDNPDMSYKKRNTLLIASGFKPVGSSSTPRLFWHAIVPGKKFEFRFEVLMK